MDRNLGNEVEWISENDYKEAGGVVNKNDGGTCQHGGICVTNEYGPITANRYLTSLTTNWEVKVGLPSKEQMEGIGCTTSYNSCPIWACDYLRDGANPVPGANGYWTSTPDSSNSGPNSPIILAWYVYSYSNIGRTGISSSNKEYVVGYGIRPVITVSKSSLN